MAWRSVILRTTGEIITASIYNETNFYNMRYLKGMDGVIALEDSITLPVGKTVDGTDISAHVATADAHQPRSHDHSLAADGTPIAVAGVPDLDTAKITTGRFGMPRMPDGPVDLVLTAQGAGVDPVYRQIILVQEIFIPVTVGHGMGFFGTYPVCRPDVVGADAYTVFYIPNDFASLILADIIIIPETTGIGNYDIHISHAAIGEPHDIHTASDTTSTYPVTANQLSAINIAPLLTALAANDYIGVHFEYMSGPAANIIGLRFRYST